MLVVQWEVRQVDVWVVMMVVSKVWTMVDSRVVSWVVD